eukprot:TRINITY_DN7860_c0_g2_i4.p2 TRINITY_DN7860_c0_g2~~TRINITY_DN7860_c0_g2_i4.p2  ORF type:complete len:142 (-),score=21.85 TRINITY_DN7860_c0_g2_i4:712-1077(-)
MCIRDSGYPIISIMLVILKHKPIHHYLVRKNQVRCICTSIYNSKQISFTDERVSVSLSQGVCNTLSISHIPGSIAIYWSAAFKYSSNRDAEDVENVQEHKINSRGMDCGLSQDLHEAVIGF